MAAIGKQSTGCSWPIDPLGCEPVGMLIGIAIVVMINRSGSGDRAIGIYWDLPNGCVTYCLFWRMGGPGGVSVRALMVTDCG